MSELRALPYAWPDVKARLQAEIGRLLGELGIDARPAGGLVTPLNPTRDDRHPGSFVIWLSGDAVGAWRDYATGESGDVFLLILYLKGLQAKIDAYWWALAFLGLERGVVRTAQADQLARDRRDRERAAAAAKAQADEDGKSAELFKRWLALAPIAGTLAETYLREARRIPLERLDRAPGALRFAPALDHIDDDTGEVTSWPCMVAAMTRGAKGVVSLHRTWLAPDGSGKAPVARPRKMIGPSKGAAIRLAMGPSGWNPKKAAERGRADPLAIGEGIETCLTVACARPDYRVWAGGSISGMGGLDWPACASAVVLLAENDWAPEARKAFAAVETRWRAMGQDRQVHIAASAVGSDFNDWAKAS